MNNKKILFLSTICILLLQKSFAQSKDENAIRFSQFINVEDAKKHLTVLTSDELEGRETGEPGQHKAAKYIAGHFKTLGLLVMDGEEATYLQRFPLNVTKADETKLKIGDTALEPYNDFYALPVGKDLVLNATEILFVGYGISEKVYDDYKKTDVKGKVLLMMGGEPLDKDSISLITGTKERTEWSTGYSKKAELAKTKGAAAVIFINSHFEEKIMYYKLLKNDRTLSLEQNNKEEEKMPQISISVKVANQILVSSGKTIKDIKQKIRKKERTISLTIKTPFELNIIAKPEKIYSENVLGFIRGRELPDEYIFVTAHYDHLGMKDGKIYRGADDDGSGTTGVLEIAHAFAQAKNAGFTPKRSIVFMTVAGEEKGLLGSSYYTDHPYVPIAATVCDLNIDMIGRIDADHKNDSSYIYVIGSDKISTELHTINEQANATYTHLNLDYKYNDPKDPNRFYYRSDHYNFAEKGVPIIFYFNGVHEDYHKPSDDISKLSFDLLVKRAQLAFFTAWEVANRKDRIKSDVPQVKEK